MRFSILFLPLCLLFACSGSGPVTLGTDGAANMDAVARKVAVDYREQCFDPLRKGNVPDDICQYKLFETAERKFGRFTEVDLRRTANLLMGESIETEVMRLLVYDKASQRYVNASVKNRTQLINALKDKYSIK
ncbi:MAG: hypothetical protein RL318_1340 [Fibrobacterota bacterium]|jgi:hypothetical protein